MQDKITQLKQSDVPLLRLKLLMKQEGKCAICGCVPDIPCLDHHHKKRIYGSGLIRGVLCNNCNVFIAKIENNASRYGISKGELTTRLSQVIAYLEHEHYPYLHPSEAPKKKKLMKNSYNELMKVCKSKIPYGTGFYTVKLKALFELKNIKPRFYK